MLFRFSVTAMMIAPAFALPVNSSSSRASGVEPFWYSRARFAVSSLSITIAARCLISTSVYSVVSVSDSARISSV